MSKNSLSEILHSLENSSSTPSDMCVLLSVLKKGRFVSERRYHQLKPKNSKAEQNIETALAHPTTVERKTNSPNELNESDDMTSIWVTF